MHVIIKQCMFARMRETFARSVRQILTSVGAKSSWMEAENVLLCFLRLKFLKRHNICQKLH